MLREIERNDWARFFESFTLQHDRWLVTVDGDGEAMPLEGIVARDALVVVTLGGDISHHRRITIDAARVRVEQNGGVDEGVAIESTDGHVTHLRFRSPMPPELVDGIA
ncbi:MAG TPA: hypothetical protein VHL59_04365 [Thermoanaerobaculia bacterium]|nr:hypothetical protein [Thermoanaerobaculia bacterium]